MNNKSRAGRAGSPFSFPRRVILIAILFGFALAYPVWGGTTCQDWGWLGSACLTVPATINLEEMNAGKVHLTDNGAVSFDYLNSGSIAISWTRTGWVGSLPGQLEFQVVEISPLVRAGALQWQGGKQTTYAVLPDNGVWTTVQTLAGGEHSGTVDLKFRYLPTQADPPGLYSVRLEFRLSTSWWRYTFTVSRESQIDWEVLPWAALAIPHDDMTVGLRTIDGSLYNPTTSTWTPITSEQKQAHAIANTHFTVTVSTKNAGVQSADLARFEIKGGDLHSFVPLGPDPGKEQTMVDTDATLIHITDIQYQYVPSYTDRPGDYAVRVIYTIVGE